MLVAEGLRKRYGPRPALQGVSLEVPLGSIVGLVGPNGAGKTTLMRIAAGILPPDGGQVTVDGKPAGSLEARRALGYVPESPLLYPEMRVDAFVAYCARLRDGGGRGLRKRVGEVLERVGAGGLAARRCGALSKGQRQAVALAQALVHDPPVLLLDEPAAGLDPVQAMRLRALVAELGASKAILLATHLLGDVRGLCGRVVVLHGGRVLASGSPEEIAASRGGVLESALLDLLERGE